MVTSVLRNKNLLYLVGMLLLSAILRLTQLSTLPISLFGDEVDVGYHAWSLITTGRDYLGHFLPTYIQSLSEWRAPLLMYLTAPFVGALGPTALAVRLPVALLGIFSVFLIYLLTKTILSSKPALISAFLLAITPWHIHYSRASFEVIPLLVLELLGTYLFISQSYFWSLVFFSLTFYLYSTATVFTPLLLLLLFVIYRPTFQATTNWLKFLFPAIILLPAIYNIFFGPAAGRFHLISIFRDQEAIDSLVTQRTDPWVKSSFAERLLHSKPLAFLTAFGTNYVQSFSPEFLFLSGDPIFRHSVGNHGELLWAALPFFLYGLFLLLTKTDHKSNQLLLSWLVVSPIASSLTQSGGNHATRLFVMLPPLIIITAIGLDVAFTKIKHRLFYFIVLSAFLISFVTFWHRYSVHYRYESARYWHNGYQQIFSQLKPLLTSGQQVYINNTSEPSLIRFAFFTALPPNDFQAMFSGDQMAPLIPGKFNGFRFGDRFYFGEVVNLNEIDKILSPGDIYLAAQGREIPGDWDLTTNPLSGLKVVGFERDVFGKPQFYILERTSP